MKTVAFCEIEEYPRKVLAKHWPDVPIYEDVKNVTAEQLRADGIGRIEVITGGFPCQDISIAGRQKGITAERSGLWSELCRIIDEVRPKYAIVENVTALLSGERGRWFGRVLGDLAEIGFDAEWHCIPASELGAHHHRDRVWIIAYPSEIGCRHWSDNREERHVQNDKEWEHKKVQRKRNEREAVVQKDELMDKREAFTKHDGKQKYVADTFSFGQQGQGGFKQSLFAKTYQEGKTINAISGCVNRIWATESAVGRVANGVPRRMDRLKGLGNAVVPQIPELIGMAIMEIEQC